jgi:hypothetical protein
MANKRQYVNLEGGDPDKGETRIVKIKLEATETQPGASEDQPAYVFIKPDGKNESNKFLPFPHRPLGFEKKPPRPLKRLIKNKKAEIEAMVSLRGGDVFTFEYGKKDDGSGAKKYSGDPIEVWRKVFFRVGHMKTCASQSVTQLQGKLDPMFIELAQDGGDTEIPHDPFGTGPASSYVSEVGKAAGTPKWPDQTIDIVFADRLFDRGLVRNFVIRKKASGFSTSKCFLATCEQRNQATGSKETFHTWPDKDHWLSGGMIYLRDHTGRQIAAQPAHQYVFPIAKDQFIRYPEGILTNTLGFDFTSFPGIDDWLKEPDNQMKIELDIFTFAGAACGKADSNTGGIVVATHDLHTNNGALKVVDALADGTVLHEIGHSIGMVLKWIYTWSEDDASEEDKVQYQWWYEGKGGKGNHCFNGSTDKGSVVEAGSKPCVMFHGSAANTTDFCSDCQMIIKRARLAKLGRTNVWGTKGWG